MELTYKIAGSRGRVTTHKANLSNYDQVERIESLIWRVTDSQVREWLDQLRAWPWPKQSGVARVRAACCYRLGIKDEA